MSIDPLKLNQFGPKAIQAPKLNNLVAQPETFEHLLSQVATEGEPAQQAVVQAEAVLKLAQLQLLQGLFANDDEAAQGDLFSALRPAPVAAPQTVTRQRVDQLYRDMQLSLRESQVPGRTDIERMIEQVADQVSLAPELIHSVVAAESDFQSQAVSHAGAQGLMQLMPATAKDLGVADSFNPQQNLLGGSRYLKQLLDKYDGDLDKTLAAYNWGQGNVDRKGLEQMPQETRNYLSKVKGLLADKI